MKKSLINNYLAALKTLINDNRITFAITGNFENTCRLATYFNNEFLCNIVINKYNKIEDMINNYKIIQVKHPINKGKEQLFSLRYNSEGYCYLASTDSSNLELFGVSHKRISKKFAQSIWNYAIDDDNMLAILSCYTGGYNTSYDFKQTILFKM